MIGKNLIKLKATESTNSYLINLAKNQKIDEGTTVIAEEQSLGRGQHNNIWESKKGKNLLLSFIIHPHFIPPVKQFEISKIVSLSVYETVQSFINDDMVKIKWPNDIYVGDRKIAGILIENTLRGAQISSSVIGIGLNVNQTEFSQEIPNPISLKKYLNLDIQIEKVAIELLNRLNYWYNILQANDINSIHQNYLNNLYKYKTTSRFKDEHGVFEGKIVKIEESGILCIQDLSNNTRKYSFKEIEFL